MKLCKKTDFSCEISNENNISIWQEFQKFYSRNIPLSNI